MEVSNGGLEDEIVNINANLTTFIIGVLYAPTLGVGFMAEVDLDYPAELHDTHNSYPLAPEKRAVGVEEELSEFSELLNCTVKKKHDKSCVMLLQTLGNKRHYFVYYKNLAFYVKHGMKLRRVHKILWFKEHPVMKSCIETNTIMRNASKSAVERRTPGRTPTTVALASACRTRSGKMQLKWSASLSSLTRF